MLLNAAKCQGYSFYCFWVIEGKRTGGKIAHPPPGLGLKQTTLFFHSNEFIVINGGLS